MRGWCSTARFSPNYRVDINVTGSISGTGDYPLIDYYGGTRLVVAEHDGQVLSFPPRFPTARSAYLAVNATNPSELDLDVTALASIVWAGRGQPASNAWNTTAQNWLVQTTGAPWRPRPTSTPPTR